MPDNSNYRIRVDTRCIGRYNFRGLQVVVVAKSTFLVEDTRTGYSLVAGSSQQGWSNYVLVDIGLGRDVN